MKFNRTQLFKLKKALLQLAEIATEEGVTLVTDTDEITTGIEVFVNGDEGLTPAPDGTYTNGNQLITVEGGVITNMAEKDLQTPETPTTEEEVVVAEEDEKPTDEEEKTDDGDETPADDDDEKPVEEEAEEEEKPAEEEEVVDVEALNARIAELEAKIAELETENAELKAKLEEPVAESVETEMKRQGKGEAQKMDYVAAIKKAREIHTSRK